jgi:hypothetical protein
MRQVEQRVSLHCTLPPLGREDVAAYISHRLQTAGGSPDRVRFSGEAVDAVYAASGGVPRLINRLCDRALHRGFQQRVCTIDRDIVEAVRPEPVAAAPTPTVAHNTAPGRDPMEAWLAHVDATASTAPPAPDPGAHSTEVAKLEQGAPSEQSAEPTPQPAPPIQLKFVPSGRVQRTHMERFTRRVTRWLATASLVLSIILVGLIGWPAVITVTTDLYDETREMFEPPSPPELPPQLPKPPAVLALPVAPEVLDPQDTAATQPARAARPVTTASASGAAGPAR